MSENRWDYDQERILRKIQRAVSKHFTVGSVVPFKVRKISYNGQIVIEGPTTIINYFVTTGTISHNVRNNGRRTEMLKNIGESYLFTIVCEAVELENSRALSNNVEYNGLDVLTRVLPSDDESLINFSNLDIKEKTKLVIKMLKNPGKYLIKEKE